MQYMIVATLKDGASPSDYATVLKKFLSWQPPAGLSMDHNWYSGRRGFTLVSTDDYTLVGELLASFSAVFNFDVEPVAPAEQIAPASLRGAEWAAS